MKVKSLIDQIVQGVLAGLKPEPKPAPKPKPAAAPARDLSDLEKVQRDFEFQRAFGGIQAEGRYDSHTGEMRWRSRW